MEQKARGGDNAGPFGRLPDKAILNIFKKLSQADLGRVARVCRLFSRIVEDPVLWKEVRLFEKKLSKEAFNIFMRRQVKHLKIRDSYILFHRFCENSVASRPDYEWRLVGLDLMCTRISAEVLTTVLTRCRQLEELHVGKDSLEIGDSVLEAIAGNKELRVLRMTLSRRASAEALANLLKSCVKLRMLFLETPAFGRWLLYQESTGGSFDPQNLDAICGNLPSSLRMLRIPSFYGMIHLLEDKNVAQIVANCPHLSDLHLDPASRITGEAVKRLSTLTELEWLTLKNSCCIPPRSLLYLKRLKNLRHIDVHGLPRDSDERTVLIKAFGNRIRFYD